MSLIPLPQNENDKVEEDKNIEMMDASHFDMICNPAYHAFKDALVALHLNPSIQIIEDIHLILLIDNSLQQTRILKIFPEIFKYIEIPEFYESMILLLCDASHLNQQVCDDLLDFGIFEKLNYSNTISFSLILNICDSNKKAWDVFKNSYLNGFENNPKIKMLIEQFK